MELLELEPVVSLTSPRDACRVASVSSAFKSAADSDTVWARFLPSDYKSLLERAVDPSSISPTSLKELYFRLCDGHVLIDGGSLSFSLDRGSGKKRYMISAKALSIIWGESPQYWQWISVPESRFPFAAELLHVCWLHIGGRIDVQMLSPDTLYAAYLVFKSGESFNGFEDNPVQADVGFVGGVEYGKRSVYLDTERRIRRQDARRGRSILREEQPDPEAAMPREDERNYPNERKDGWMEVELGEVCIDEGPPHGEVEMNVKEVQRLNWKSGIIIQGIEIRPKEDAKVI